MPDFDPFITDHELVLELARRQRYGVVTVLCGNPETESELRGKLENKIPVRAIIEVRHPKGPEAAKLVILRALRVTYASEYQKYCERYGKQPNLGELDGFDPPPED